jgi:hypothetical protein
MADVTVFVDDAVRGTLPGICVKDGVATVDHLVIRDHVGDRAGLGVAWLLLLTGPLGWLGLVVISYVRGGRSEVLTVEVPMSEPAYQRIRAARRLRRRAMVVLPVVLIGFLVGVTSSSDGTSVGAFQGAALGLIAAAVVVVAVITVIIADRRSTKATIGVDLDASRRWVTLSRVHPAFVAACQVQEQRQVQRT